MARRKNPFKLDVVSVRLVKDAPIRSGCPIHSPEDAVALIGQELCEMDREVLCVINMKADGTPINCNFASVGVLNETIAHPREIFKSSILSNAAQMMLVHNHPSSRLTPSKADTILTDRMVKLCDYIGIPLIDHIIVGGDNTKYFSFREKDIMPMSKIRLETDYKNIDFASPLVAEKGRAR